MQTTFDPKVWQSLRELEAVGEPGFLRSLLEEFLTSTERRLLALQAAGASADAGQIEHEAHSLKGSCGALGAWTLMDLCQQLEQVGHAGSCAGHVELLEQLQAEWSQVRTELETELQEGLG